MYSYLLLHLSYLLVNLNEYIRDEIGGKSKSLKVGVHRLQKPPCPRPRPVGSRDNIHGKGQGTKPWHFIPFQIATPKYSLLFFKAFFQGTNQATPLVGGRGQSPQTLKAFSKSKVCTQKKNKQKTNKPTKISWHFILFQIATQKYSLLCFKVFFQRNKPGLHKCQYPKL